MAAAEGGAAKRIRLSGEEAQSPEAAVRELFSATDAEAQHSPALQAAVLQLASASQRVQGLLRGLPIREEARRKAISVLEEAWMQAAQRLDRGPSGLTGLLGAWGHCSDLVEAAGRGRDWSVTALPIARVTEIYAAAAAEVSELQRLTEQLTADSTAAVVERAQLPPQELTDLCDAAARGALVWPDTDPAVAAEFRAPGTAAPPAGALLRTDEADRLRDGDWAQALVWRAAGDIRLVRPLTNPAVRRAAAASPTALALHSLVYRAMFCEGQAMGLPQEFHDAAAAEPWAVGCAVRLEMYTHLLNKRCAGWLSCSLFPAVDGAVGRVQDFDPAALVRKLKERGWSGVLSCNPPYVEDVFNRDLPRVAAAVAAAAECGVGLSCIALLPSFDAGRWAECPGTRALAGSPYVRSRWLLPKGRHRVVLQDGSRDVVMGINQLLLLLSTDPAARLCPTLWRHLAQDGEQVLPPSFDLQPVAKGSACPPLVLTADFPREPYRTRPGQLRLAQWWPERCQALAAFSFLRRRLPAAGATLVRHRGAGAGVLRWLKGHFAHAVWEECTATCGAAPPGTLLLSFAGGCGGGAGGGAAEEAQWRKRMQQQQLLLAAVRPAAALLTFRPPYAEYSSTAEWAYPSGELRLPVWGHPSSTLCWLETDGAAAEVSYGLAEHEERMSFFNSVARERWHFNHSVGGPGLDHHYDARAEVELLGPDSSAERSAELSDALGATFADQIRNWEDAERCAAERKGHDRRSFNAFILRRRRALREPLWHRPLDPPAG